jgi:hypothetical protein
MIARGCFLFRQRRHTSSSFFSCTPLTFLRSGTDTHVPLKTSNCFVTGILFRSFRAEVLPVACRGVCSCDRLREKSETRQFIFFYSSKL